MRRKLVFHLMVALASTFGTIGLIAGCSTEGSAGDLPDSIGPVSSPDDSVAKAKELEQLKGKGYKGAPGIPYKGK